MTPAENPRTRGTTDLEKQAETAVRLATASRLPVSHQHIQDAIRAVQGAYERGHAVAMAEVIDAYKLFLDTDDLDGFRDALTDLSS